MGAVANAATLIKDPIFLDWCMAAAAYQARQVLLEDPLIEDHQLRKDLAVNVANDPLNFRTRFTVYIATDPTVAVKGNTAALVGEQTVLDKIAAIWTTVAKMGVM
jgi:hypothetical protein